MRADRVGFRLKHKLAVLVVSVIPLIELVSFTCTLDYAVCTSWVAAGGVPDVRRCWCMITSC